MDQLETILIREKGIKRVTGQVQCLRDQRKEPLAEKSQLRNVCLNDGPQFRDLGRPLRDSS